MRELCTWVGIGTPLVVVPLVLVGLLTGNMWAVLVAWLFIFVQFLSLVGVIVLDD